MKKEKNDKAIINKANTGEGVKTDLPIKNTMTDAVQNTARQAQCLNQANTTRDDLFPSDGDNMTN